MSQLPVLFVIDALWVGGSERSLVEMLPRLEQEGLDGKVVVLRRRREGVEGELPPDRIRVLAARSFSGRVRKLRRVLREERPAVVHSSLFLANLVTRFAAVGLPVKVVNSLVSTPYDAARRADPRVSGWRLRLVQLLDAVTGRLLVDRFHAVSHAAAAAAVRDQAIPGHRITVVPRGRDPERLGTPGPGRRRRVRDLLGLPAGVPVVVSVGRQDYPKGQDDLLEAVARLTGDYPDLILLVAGRSGSLTAALEHRAATSELAGRIRFLGHRDDVPDLLAAADVFAFPSRFEGYPGAVLEAMALGLPVVASDIPPVREIVQPEVTGLLVPPRNPQALAEALHRLLQDRTGAARLGERGRRRFLERHTLDSSIPPMARFYRSLAGELPGPLLMAEPNYQRDRHSSFNAALLVTAGRAFQEGGVLFAAEASHLEWVRDALAARGNGTGDVEWRTVQAPPPLQRAGRLRRALHEWKAYRDLLVAARRRRAAGVLFCSVSKLGLVALAVLPRLRRQPPIRAFLHQLYYLETEKERRWPWRIWNLRNLLALPAAQRVRWIAPGEVAFANLEREHPALARGFLSFEPPYRWTREAGVAPPGSDEPVRFGFFGVGRRDRIEPFFDLAQRVRSTTTRAEFVLVGHLKGVAPEAAGGAVSGLENSALDPAAFDQRAAGLHYAVWTGRGEYGLRLSASLLDALSHVKPLVCLRDPVTERCFRQMGDVGHLCEDLDEMVEVIRRLAEDFPVDSYRIQCENLLAGRRPLAPENRATHLRRLFAPEPEVQE